MTLKMEELWPSLQDKLRLTAHNCQNEKVASLHVPAIKFIG